MRKYDEMMKDVLLEKLRASFPGMKPEHDEVAWASYRLGWDVALEIIRSKVEGEPCEEHGPPVGILILKNKCAWKDEGDYWESSCGEHWGLEDGTPSENNMKYCHGCGKEIG